MARHCEPRTGLWTTSSDEEAWPGQDFFDTREEARDHARANEHLHVGQIVLLDDQEVAKSFLRSGHEAQEHILEQEEWDFSEYDLIKMPTAEQAKEAVKLLAEWVNRNGLKVKAWMVKRVEFVPPAHRA